MANTFNLNLEEINANDTIKTDFIEKLNNNMSKLDDAFGLLKLKLMNKTEKTNLNDAIDEFVSAEDARIEMERMASIGDAEANNIENGKVALVQGQRVVGTRTFMEMEMKEVTINQQAQSVTFTFDRDITNARIIYEAIPVSTYIDDYYSGVSNYVLVHYDSNDNGMYTCLYTSSRYYQSFLYKYTNSNFKFTKNGNQLTISGVNSNYTVGSYSNYQTLGRCIAIWE